MSCSISVPNGILTDAVFPFNGEHFIKIREAQEADFNFITSLPLTKSLIGAGDIVGGAATTVAGGFAQGASAATAGIVGGANQLLGGVPILGHLSGAFGQFANTTVGAAGTLGTQLVDPTKVVRQNINYSNDIKDKLPAAMSACDKAIRDFAFELGHEAQDLYENLASKGLQIVAGFEKRLTEVFTALLGLYQLLTSNNMEENLQVGKEKYLAVEKIIPINHHLGEIAVELPFVLKAIADVKAAFEVLHSSFKIIKAQISYGITDPSLIFKDSHEEVVAAWQGLEVRRKTMTYLPYKY